jgi:hypothetical protein
MFAQTTKQGTLMKLIATITCALALAIPAVASADSSHGCDIVNFGAEVLEKMPNAKKLCRGIAEKNGTVYVHYIAEVESRTATDVTVKFLDKNDKAVSRVKFEPTSDQTVMVDKKASKYTSLDKGQKLDFWIAQNKWGLFSNPDGKAMKIVSVEQL